MRAGAKALKGLKAAGGFGKASKIGKNAAKGRAFENFLVKSKGLSKYEGKTIRNSQGAWRPDFAGYGEAKATKYLSNNRQMRAMCEFAGSNPEESVTLYLARGPGGGPHLTNPLLNNLLDSGVGIEYVDWFI